jgi:hypothetical protein
MGISRRWLAIASALLLNISASAQSHAQTPTQATGQDSDTPIMLIGCVQSEAEFRRTHDLGRGGVAATGLGRDNEYVLINASKTTADGVDCTFRGSVEAYELTGTRERELKPFVGRVVQISGMLKKAETRPVGTSGNVEPTGGVDPLRQDLRLFEVNVTSFQEPAAAVAQAPAPAQPSAPPPAGSEPQPVATSGVEELPRTASPLPLAGMLGFLSLGAALGLRVFRR